MKSKNLFLLVTPDVELGLDWQWLNFIKGYEWRTEEKVSGLGLKVLKKTPPQNRFLNLVTAVGFQWLSLRTLYQRKTWWRERAVWLVKKVDRILGQMSGEQNTVLGVKGGKE